MDRVFVRNYVLFVCLLIICAGSLIYILLSGNMRIGEVDERVTHTQKVIISAEQLATLVEGMLAAQRGYIITGQESFLEDYGRQKEDLSQKIAAISDLTSDNPSQASRMEELRNYKTTLTTKLEERAAKYKPSPGFTNDFLDQIEVVNQLKQSIIGINEAVLEEEYGLLRARFREVENQKTRYFNILLVGVVTFSGLLLLFNGFLLRVQRKRLGLENMLQTTEKRYVLAMERTHDGIFDWDLVTGKIFYSARVFGMLGYNKGSYTGVTEDFAQLIHPEDSPRIWQIVEDYLGERIPEYSLEYRAKSADGRWVWIHSRAGLIKDAKGKPVRLVGAHTDISLMKERQEQLEQDKKAAEEANRAKSDFLAHMSHEIRTPLTAVSGIAEILTNKQDNLDEKQKGLVRILNSSTAALKDLINDILDFSKIESRELELVNDEFDLAGLFEEIISIMSLKAHEKAISFVFNYDDLKDCTFYGDRARMRQILINLVGNALKFTESGGVTVAAYRENRNDEIFLRVEVADTGIGIATENFDLIFERFKQADSSVARKYGGTGLGLPISRNLAELMGGKIILSSQTGKGSTFTLLIPDKKGTLAVTEDKPAEESREMQTQIKTSLLRETKLLIVEDYEANITVIGYILEDAGCKYDVARNGKEAVEHWQKNAYDVILMDVQMPVMDGFSATAQIRKLESDQSLARTPIIGMTAHALVGDKDKCIEAGMDAYLPKPIVENNLRQEIFRFVKKKKAVA